MVCNSSHTYCIIYPQCSKHITILPHVMGWSFMPTCSASLDNTEKAERQTGILGSVSAIEFIYHAHPMSVENNPPAICPLGHPSPKKVGESKDFYHTISLLSFSSSLPPAELEMNSGNPVNSDSLTLLFIVKSRHALCSLLGTTSTPGWKKQSVSGETAKSDSAVVSNKNLSKNLHTSWQQ